MLDRIQTGLVRSSEIIVGFWLYYWLRSGMAILTGQVVSSAQPVIDLLLALVIWKVLSKWLGPEFGHTASDRKVRLAAFVVGVILALIGNSLVLGLVLFVCAWPPRPASVSPPAPAIPPTPVITNVEPQNNEPATETSRILSVIIGLILLAFGALIFWAMIIVTEGRPQTEPAFYLAIGTVLISLYIVQRAFRNR